MDSRVKSLRRVRIRTILRTASRIRSTVNITTKNSTKETNDPHARILPPVATEVRKRTITEPNVQQIRVGGFMPEKKTVERARKDAREGKAPSTQAGEFVREEMEHIRKGKHGARSTKQAIAIGLSKARQAGVKLAPPKKGKSSERTRKQAERDVSKRRTAAKKKPS